MHDELKSSCLSFIGHRSAFIVSFHSSAFILALVLLSVVLLLALAVLAALAHHKKRAPHMFDLTGRVGSVVEALRPEGAVLIDGELWRACVRSGGELARGRVRVVGARGHLLEVEAEG
ncbi:MAG: hypothetical protein DMF64_06105 [Acidobacteria bacterium]|nr:MAG: hypothetical protein DMF64_06105 [Acidobacteriota bacterium]